MSKKTTAVIKRMPEPKLFLVAARCQLPRLIVPAIAFIVIWMSLVVLTVNTG